MNVQSSAITASSPDGEGGKNVTVRGLHVVLLQPHNSSGMSTVELV